MSTNHGVAPASNYLQECLERQGAVAEALFRKPQNLGAIEEEVSKVESGSLIYDHIEPIMKVDPWGGQQFWQWPSREQFNDRRGPMLIVLWDVTRRTKEDNRNREKERNTVEELLRVFRHIEPVSVVLRFLAPNRFGILSPPVEKLLEVSPSSSPAEKYLSYVEDLRVIKGKRGFRRVADVDMAIWTLQQVMDYPDRLTKVAPKRTEWRKKYEGDRLLREIRVRNLTQSLIGAMELGDLAEAWVPEDIRDTYSTDKRTVMAGLLAGVLFERAVMKRATKVGRRKESLEETINALDLPSDVKSRWHCARQQRNRAVHNERPLPLPSIRDLLKAMREAE